MGKKCKKVRTKRKFVRKENRNWMFFKESVRIDLEFFCLVESLGISLEKQPKKSFRVILVKLLGLITHWTRVKWTQSVEQLNAGWDASSGGNNAMTSSTITNDNKQ